MNVFKLIKDNGLTLHGDIEHFAELVRQEEREACAKVCAGEVTGEVTGEVKNPPTCDQGVLL